MKYLVQQLERTKNKMTSEDCDCFGQEGKGAMVL